MIEQQKKGLKKEIKWRNKLGQIFYNIDNSFRLTTREILYLDLNKKHNSQLI
jgi:hypothetical protein